MKSCTTENIAGSGLNLGHLRLIFKRSGEDGLVDVFSMKNQETKSYIRQKSVRRMYSKTVCIF